MTRQPAISIHDLSWTDYRKLVEVPKKSKYGNVKTVVDGITFDSAAESRRYLVLRQRERDGEIRDLELQPKFKLYGMGHTLICTYRADFGYGELTDGQVFRNVVEDVKGVRTPIYSLKAKLFADNYGFEITEVQA